MMPQQCVLPGDFSSSVFDFSEPHFCCLDAEKSSVFTTSCLASFCMRLNSSCFACNRAETIKIVRKTSNAFTLTLPHNTSVLNNKVTNTTSYDIHSSEQTLPRHMCTKVAQVRANKSPLLQIYLYTVQ